MLDQLLQLMQEQGKSAVENSPAIPNELNSAVNEEATSSVINGLQQLVAQGKMSEVMQIFQGDTNNLAQNPLTNQLTNGFLDNISEKFGIDKQNASGLAGSLIPSILGALVGKTQSSQGAATGGFDLTAILGSLLGGASNNAGTANQQGGGLGNIINSIGGAAGLDKNKDGKIDLGDVGGFISDMLNKK